MHRQGQKYIQKHETKRLVEFHNHFHALTMVIQYSSYNPSNKKVTLSGETGSSHLNTGYFPIERNTEHNGIFSLLTA